MPATERSYTKNFFKVQYIIIQAILSRKSMKQLAVIDENIFHVYKAFDRKKITAQPCGYEDFPRTKGFQHGEEDSKNKILS